VVIHRCQPGNNPNPRNLFVDMEGSAEASELSVYDPNMRCVFRAQAGALNPGWNNLPLPAELAQLSNGTYFFRLGAQRQGRQADPVTGRLVVLR
jgi:hypothetical protein